MILNFLIFMVDPTMNLINGFRHECEKKEYHFLQFRKKLRITPVKEELLDLSFVSLAHFPPQLGVLA